MCDGLPGGWEPTTLGAIATLGGGTTPSKGEQGYWQNGTVPWATPTDITSLPTGCDRISKTEIEVSERALAECSLTVNPPGAVLMTSRATIGYAAINDVPMTTNQGFINFRCGERADPQFLLHWLTAKREFLVAAAGGSTFKELSRGTAKLLPILLPPLDEQWRIAEVLRSVDDAVASNELTRIHAERLLFTYLSDAFVDAAGNDQGGEVRAIEEMLTSIIDYRGVPPPKAESGIPLITAKNVRFGYLDVEPKEYIAAGDYGSWMRRGIPSEGDILFTTEAPLGNVAQFPSYKAALGQRTITLVPNPDILDKKYLKWLLLSPPAQNLIQSHGTGSTAKGIKQRTFRKLKFQFPPIEQQIRIGAICEEMSDFVSVTTANIASLSLVKASLSADLLSGRVRVSV